ncbi:hypothetical protein ACS0TY_035412 [Phlomoides rotata]
MNMQQVGQPRSSSDGYGHHKIERDSEIRFDSEGELYQPNSHDRLIYITTCLTGHQVEVQVKDGSVFSGIFHATDAEDFGIVLKMARTIKYGSQISHDPTKPPSRTLVIPAKNLVQVIAKGVPVTRNGLTNEFQHEKQQELMTDSCISRSGHVDGGRELERWVPDENDLGCRCPELENIFDVPWNRGWDQFEVNETLFGVKSTFDEDLYTTKLERGPQMREKEREALRIAREIEGEETYDLHLAEERGIQLEGNVEMDEETRFSSVCRGINDSGLDEVEDIVFDSRNVETFGGGSGSVIGKNRTDTSSGKTSDGAQVSSISSLMGESQSSRIATSRDVHHSGFEDHAEQLPRHSSSIDSCRVHDDTLIGHPGTNYHKGYKEKQKLLNESQVSNAEDSDSLLRSKEENYDAIGLSAHATAFDPSHVPQKVHEKTGSSSELSEGKTPPNTRGTASSLAPPSCSASSTSDRGGATLISAGRGLSPSSSVGSLSSEKSTLNPHAKEFKFNASAKSFTPSQIPLRPSSPVADTPFYYPASMATVANMHVMPVGVEIGPPFVQPVMFSPQGAPMAQPYYHPNGPQYGQQMIIGQPRPGLYMPSYPSGMQYK